MTHLIHKSSATNNTIQFHLWPMFMMICLIYLITMRLLTYNNNKLYIYFSLQNIFLLYYHKVTVLNDLLEDEGYKDEGLGDRDQME